MIGHSLRIELLNSAEQLHALEPEWNAVLAESASAGVFLTWEWISTWWEHFGTTLRPWILVAREAPGGRAAGIAPLVLRRHPFRGPCRELSLIGNTAGAADHLDVIARAGWERAVAAGFVETLQSHRHQWDVLRLDGLRAESAFLGALRQHDSGTAMIWDSVCPFLRLPDTRDEFFAMLDRKVRSSLRRRAKLLERDSGGTVEYQRVDSLERLPTALNEVFRLHQAIRTERGDRGAFCDPLVRRFHERLAERFLLNDRLRLYLLNVNGRAIAAAYCFRYGQSVSFYQTGYDPQWARYGPGSAVIAQAICDSIHDGAREFDFLRGAEPYKSQWTRTARRDVRLRLAATRRGSLLVLTYRLARAARHALRNWCNGTSGAADANGDAVFVSEPR
ncbi:MAG: GNAT family N-acetyltransferase [Planctomycetaceae bacterium]